VKRYNHEYFGPGDDVGGNMNEADDGGEWVRYEDHVAALAESRAECERLRAENGRLLDEYYGGRTHDYEASERRANAAESKLAAAEALLREWSNFDFDCPEEYDPETDEEGEDGDALDRLYERTGVHLASSQPAAPARSEAEQKYVVQGRETVINAATGRGVCQAYSNEYAIQIAVALNVAPARSEAPKKDEGAK
jgi:hypothetical protein